MASQRWSVMSSMPVEVAVRPKACLFVISRVSFNLFRDCRVSRYSWPAGCCGAGIEGARVSGGAELDHVVEQQTTTGRSKFNTPRHLLSCKGKEQYYEQ